MRSKYKQVLKAFFHQELTRFREENRISQKEMAKHLSLSQRAYYCLDEGKSCCSEVTLVLFLIYLCPDPIVFLENLKRVMEGDGAEKESKYTVNMYRIPLEVKEILLFANGISYPICPRCDCTLEREYASYCDRCGQKLGWEDFEEVQIVHAPRFRRNQEF